MFFSGGGGGFVVSDSLSLSLSLSVVVVVVVVGLKVDFLDLDLFVKVVQNKRARARERERALKRRINKCYFRNPISLPAEFSIAKNSPAMPPQIAAVTAVGFFRHPRPPFGIVVFAPAQKPNG